MTVGVPVLYTGIGDRPPALTLVRAIAQQGDVVDTSFLELVRLGVPQQESV